MAAMLIFNSLPLPQKPSNSIPISHKLSPIPQFSPNSRPISPNLSFRGMLPLRSETKGSDFAYKALSDGGSGGAGDFRGSGGGGGDGDGDKGDGEDWSILKWYMMCLESHPVITKSLTTALLNLIGDLVCQIFIDHVENFDVKRTAMFTFLGLVLVGPVLHFWYLSLSKMVTLSGAPGTILRLLLDQFIFSPIFIGVFLSALLTLEGRPSLIQPKLEQEWFSSVLANWQLWIPFQFLNFQFVPQQFQVLAANVVALAWNVILSFKAHKEVIVKQE